MTLNQFLLILRARWMVIVSVFLCVVFATYVVNLMLPEQYTSRTSVVIDSKSSDPILGAMLPNQTLTSYIATQVDIISSDRVAQRVASILQLDQIQPLQDRWRERTGGEGSMLVWLGGLLQGNLKVVPGRDSNVINIFYSGADPDLVAAVANGFGQAYIETNLELKVEPARQYAEWFDQRTRSLRAELEQKQRKLSDYQKQRGIVAATDERLDIESARLAELSTQLSTAEGLGAESRARLSQSDSADTLSEVMQNGLIQSLKGDLARLESARDQLSVRFGQNHPEIQRANAEIDGLQQKVAAETRRVAVSLGTTNRVSTNRLDELEDAIEAQKGKVLTLRAQRDEIAVLQRDVENAQRSFDLVTQRLAQSNLESETQQTNVVVLTPAVVATTPSGPRVKRNVLLAIVLGGTLGVGFAMLLEFMNGRIRSRDDLVAALDLPVIGTMPHGRRMARRGWRGKMQATYR